MTHYPIKHPVIFLAFGLGSGLAPKAPGTAGSALALVFLPLLACLGWWGSAIFIVVAAIFGVWLCGQAAHILGVHDHASIVWDEFVGQWLALFPIVGIAAINAETVVATLLAFALFRLFDIKKPWPISWCDQHLEGGLGIMLDDIIAGLVAGGVLWGIMVSGFWPF
ncbi:phosphatidylglycerophosphatase A [Agitococcus lubricus]|uniref:Phosphatidylglycerophosphatase A n=1 Tax=Agitococcus lubricus TaxID=1077255 RepID=A0A2T5IUK1_9GAMM|nr:phosphatidylglycerophosphatase A [Agitococcus lubricus]PTQ87540.1 phosphatidylglycerophosphatase A [Agitococcus lubricus]